LNALKGGSLYFAIVFLLGIFLGTIRVLALSPRFGELLAVFIEAPFILGVSWFVSGFVIRRLRIESAFAPRFTMGVSAFGLLMIAEILLGLFGFERSLGEQLADFAATPGLVGLSGQVLFGLIPVIRLFMLVDER